MESTLRVEVRIQEKGADSRRANHLANDLLNLLTRVGGLTAERSFRESPAGSKGAAEIIPAVVSISISAATLLPKLAHLIDTWISRDRHRKVALKNSKTGVEVDFEGFSAAQITAMLEGWASTTENREDAG